MCFIEKLKTPTRESFRMNSHEISLNANVQRGVVLAGDVIRRVVVAQCAPAKRVLAGKAVARE